MHLLAIFRSLGPVDLKNVRRDDLLAWVVAAPLLIALLYRFGVPALTALLHERAGFALEPYYGLLMSFLVLMAPAMIGMIVGFLLLDERDERIVTALLVTPMPLNGYLAYRIAAPLGFGFLATLVAYPLAGLASIPLLNLIPIALLASFNAPLTALFLGGFAENKVTGFALVKVLNTVNMLPIAAYFLAFPWQIVAGVIPSYWPLKAVWLATAGESAWLYLLGGLVVNTVALVLLLRRFRTVVYR
jgi:fluoroquinolone transport system permease protein